MIWKPYVWQIRQFELAPAQRNARRRAQDHDESFCSKALKKKFVIVARVGDAEFEPDHVSSIDKYMAAFNHKWKPRSTRST